MQSICSSFGIISLSVAACTAAFTVSFIRQLVWCVSGHIHSRVVYYLMNIRVLPRTIYITRVSKEC